MLYTSRYSNPELKTRKYTAVRISLGSPKWNLGYDLSGEINLLKPFGLLNKFEEYELFKDEYFKMLDRRGVYTIRKVINSFERIGKDVVLLCYEDIRKPNNWCHRTAFTEWWLKNTGEVINELFDPTQVQANGKTGLTASKAVFKNESKPFFEQLSFF